MSLVYLWSKFLKKIRCSAIVQSNIHRTSKVESGSNIFRTNFGKHSYCGYNCEIIDAEIGSFCSIANNVVIGGAAHPVEWISTSPVFYRGRDSVITKFADHQWIKSIQTHIGSDVWIGEKAIVKRGIRIGTGAVVGMGTVATKDIPPYAIVAGCPGRILKMRFDESTIERLLASEWRTFDDSKLRKHAIHFNNPARFLEDIES